MILDKTVKEPSFMGGSVEDFCSYTCYTQNAAKRFLNSSLKAQLGKIVAWVIGPETERYAAKPVYGPTGKGYLKSKGVEGLLADEKIIAYVFSDEGKMEAYPFLEAAEKRVSKKYNLPIESTSVPTDLESPSE